MDCSHTLKTTQDEYFEVDFALISQNKTDIDLGSCLRANGVIVAIEMFGTDLWLKYFVQIEGNFSITDTVEIF